MVRVNNCCGCCDLKSGTISISIVYLVLAILAILANMALGIAGGTKGVIMYIGVTLDGVMVILCILLIIGAIKDNHLLCMVWVVGAIVWSVLETLVAVVYSVLVPGIASNAAQHIHPDPDPTVDPAVVGAAVAVVLGVMWAIVAVKISLVIYSAIVVYSHAQNLREGGGGSPPPYSQFGAPKI